MGPNVEFVSRINDSFYKKKIIGKLKKRPDLGGVREGDHTFSVFFSEPFPKLTEFVFNF